MGKATQDLRKEHEAILYVLSILDQMLQSQKGEETLLHDYGEVAAFLKTFADKCHHGKEENYLFQALLRKGIRNEGGPVGAMLTEHDQGRSFIAQMSHSLESKDIQGFRQAAAQYRDLLRSHIEKENNVLFQLADRVIGEQEQDLLFDQFEQHEETVIGHGVHDKLHAMIGEWEKEYGVE
jgi:hemerythrin-like domain-containing protein